MPDLPRAVFPNHGDAAIRISDLNKSLVSKWRFEKRGQFTLEAEY